MPTRKRPAAADCDEPDDNATGASGQVGDATEKDRESASGQGMTRQNDEKVSETATTSKASEKSKNGKACENGAVGKGAKKSAKGKGKSCENGADGKESGNDKDAKERTASRRPSADVDVGDVLKRRPAASTSSPPPAKVKQRRLAKGTDDKKDASSTSSRLTRSDLKKTKLGGSIGEFLTMMSVACVSRARAALTTIQTLLVCSMCSGTNMLPIVAATCCSALRCGKVQDVFHAECDPPKQVFGNFVSALVSEVPDKTHLHPDMTKLGCKEAACINHKNPDGSVGSCSVAGQHTTEKPLVGTVGFCCTNYSKLFNGCGLEPNSYLTTHPILPCLAVLSRKSSINLIKFYMFCFCMFCV